MSVPAERAGAARAPGMRRAAALAAVAAATAAASPCDHPAVLPEFPGGAVNIPTAQASALVDLLYDMQRNSKRMFTKTPSFPWLLGGHEWGKPPIVLHVKVFVGRAGAARAGEHTPRGSPQHRARPSARHYAVLRCAARGARDDAQRRHPPMEGRGLRAGRDCRCVRRCS